MSNLEMHKFMRTEEIQNTGVNKLNENEKQELLKWGLRMFSLGQHHNGEIEAIKYDGRLIILDDGTRWEVEDYDSSTSSLWDTYDKVVVINDEMYKLDDSEKVTVTEEII